MTQVTKICASPHCPFGGRLQKIEEFVISRHAKDGRYKYCKTCSAMKFRRWYDKNRAKQIEAAKAWTKAHPEAAREQARKGYYRRKAMQQLQPGAHQHVIADITLSAADANAKGQSGQSIYMRLTGIKSEERD